MSNKMFVVIKREFLSRIKTKSFIIGTAVFPFLMVIMVVLPIALSMVKSEKPKTFVVIDLSNRIFLPLQKALDDTTEQGTQLFHLVSKEILPEDLFQAKKSLKQQVLDGTIDGYLIVPKDVLETSGNRARKKVEFYAKNVSNFRLNERLESAISRVVRTLRLQESGLDPIVVNRLIRDVSLETFKVVKGSEDRKDKGFTFGITYLLTMILYMMMIIYGSMITRSVIEEKNTRVVEMVVSSVKPFELMTGKIIGVGAVGLLQFLIWAFFMLVVSGYRMSVAQMMGANPSILADLPSLPVNVVIFFVVFFVLGFLFFSTLYAGAGAIVNSEQEAQQVQIPLIMFLVVPILLMTYIIGNPDSTLSIVLSMIPFFSPIIMFMRVAVLTPPLLEIGLSIFFLLFGILLMIWIVGKIYRVGILMYGKRPTLPELLKWIRYS